MAEAAIGREGLGLSPTQRMIRRMAAPRRLFLLVYTDGIRINRLGVMNNLTLQRFALISGFVFLFGALLHLVAMVFDAPIIFFGWTLPFWANTVSFALGMYLAFQSFQLFNGKR